MRFMMLMIPKGYENAAPGAMPETKAVAAMMKYNESLQKAGVLLSLEGLHPPSMGARPPDRGKRPHAGVHAIHRPPVAQRLPGLDAALLHYREQGRVDADGLAGGNGPDQAEIRVTGFGDRQGRHL